MNFLNDFQLKITHFLFGDITKLVLHIFAEGKKFRIDYSSDSHSMLVLVIILLFTSLFLSILVKENRTKYLLPIIEYFCVLYISIILIKYGVDKIFGTQFPKPEANILFTRFGNLDKDILFWSTIGTSKVYNFTIGFLEIFSGIVLIFNRTKNLGLLLAIMSFVQILIINFSFDISVKLFSSILLIISIFLMRKSAWKLIQFIIQLEKGNLSHRTKFLPYKTFFTIIVLGFTFVNIGLPYFNNSFFMEDKKNPLNLVDVYQITNPESPYQYLFFHKDQYLILMEKSSEKMLVYHYEITFDNQIILEDEQRKISKHSLFIDQKNNSIHFGFNNQEITAKAVHYSKMNALQDQFHFLVD